MDFDSWAGDDEGDALDRIDQAPARSPSDFDVAQLARGVAREKEQTDDPAEALSLAMEHLTSDPEYYHSVPVSETSRVSITRGMANAMIRGGVARSCSECGLGIPKYRGRYPVNCPTCGNALAHPHAEPDEGAPDDATVTEAIKQIVSRPTGRVATSQRWMGEAITKALPSNAVTFLRPVAQKKVAELLRQRFVFLGDRADSHSYTATFALEAAPHDPRVEFAVAADDFDEADDGAPMGWAAEVRDVYGRSPDPRVPRRVFFEGLGSTVNDAVKRLARKWQAPFVFESPVATSDAASVKARAKIMADASKALGQRVASLEVRRRYHGFYLMARDVTGHYWTSMDDDAPVTGDEDEWLVAVADGKTVQWDSAKSWVKEDRGPVVAVSLVPRLQKLIEAGTCLTDERANTMHSMRRLVPFDAVAEAVPGGVAGLEAFLEGPVGEGVYYRLEGPMDPVLIFEVSKQAQTVTIYATEAPAVVLGIDPREQLVAGRIGEADEFDDLVADALEGSGQMGEALEDEAMSVRPTPGYVLAQRPDGATRAHGAFRFRIGHNRNRKPANDLAQAIQNRRNARRGLASRIKAAKSWHRGPGGQELHKALGRYNTGGHRGEAAEVVRAHGEAARQAADESVTGLVPSATVLDVQLPPSLGYPRTEMPQVEPVYDFIEYLRGIGVVVNQETVSVKALSGSQDVDPEKVKSMAGLEVDKLREPPIVVSADHFILDGHHRWAALYYLGPLNEILVYRVMLPFRDLLKLAQDWPGATYKMVGEALEETRRPEDRVYQMGGRWWLRQFGSRESFPSPFNTKASALEMATRNEIMAKDRGVTDGDEEKVKAALAGPAPKKVPLSKAVRQVNKNNEPPGGWSAADKVGEAVQWVTRGSAAYSTAARTRLTDKKAYALVWADIAHVVAHEEAGYRVPLTGGDAGNIAKVAGVRAHIAKGKPLDPTIVDGVDSSGISIQDGRHRIVAAYQEGETRAPFIVPRKLLDAFKSLVGSVTEAVHSTVLPGVPDRSVDDIFDALLRRLVVIESTDVLEDVEFTDKGSIYLFFDPSLSPAEMDEVIRSLQSEEPSITLIASPDKSLPGETAGSDWWVMFLSGKTLEGQEPIDPQMYAREPGQAGAPKQMVVQAQTTLDAIAASVDTSKLVQAAAAKDTGDTQ